MKRRFALSMAAILAGSLHGLTNPAKAGVDGPGCSAKNGDVNADRAVDLSDAITLLGKLFLGNPPQLPPLCIPARSGLPQTGQRACFDAFGSVIDCGSDISSPGQDGFYATGCASEGRFIDNGDGTVTDACTDLVWQKKTADVDGDGQVTPWSVRADTPDKVTWQGALQYCEDLELAGYRDWRLPNARELESIVDYGRRNPSMDPAFETELAYYWSSSSAALHSELAWSVAFYDCSSVYQGHKEDDRCFVRAVRSCTGENGDVNGDGAIDLSDAITFLGKLFLGNPPLLPQLCSTRARSGLPQTGQRGCYDAVGKIIDCATGISFPGQDGFYATGCAPEGRFIDHGDGTVTDTCTDLIWQKMTADVNGDGEVTPRSAGADSPDRVTWQEALRYCEQLEFSGHDDWRLPNVRELESILDYGRHDPCIYPVFEAASSPYWTSTNLVSVNKNPWESAWAVGFLHIYVYHHKKGSTHFVRAVRNAPR